MKARTVEVENVNTPGRVGRVNAAKYNATRNAMLSMLTAGSPPLTFDEIIAGVRPMLPGELFPGGATSGWWVKTVQLDLEAKGLITRHATKPLSFSRTR